MSSSPHHKFSDSKGLKFTSAYIHLALRKFRIKPVSQPLRFHPKTSASLKFKYLLHVRRISFHRLIKFFPKQLGRIDPTFFALLSIDAQQLFGGIVVILGFFFRAHSNKYISKSESFISYLFKISILINKNNHSSSSPLKSSCAVWPLWYLFDFYDTSSPLAIFFWSAILRLFCFLLSFSYS